MVQVYVQGIVCYQTDLVVLLGKLGEEFSQYRVKVIPTFGEIEQLLQSTLRHPLLREMIYANTATSTGACCFTAPLRDAPIFLTGAEIPFVEDGEVIFYVQFSLFGGLWVHDPIK